MSWFTRFHDDHRAVHLLLAKLEGNLLDLPHQGLHPNMVTEFEEFVEVIEGELKPHFQAEEKDVYPRAAGLGRPEAAFIEGMLEEHRRLYAAFEGFRRAVAERDAEGIVRHGKAIVRDLREHTEKEETDVRRMVRQAESR